LSSSVLTHFLSSIAHHSYFLDILKSGGLEDIYFSLVTCHFFLFFVAKSFFLTRGSLFSSLFTFSAYGINIIFPLMNNYHVLTFSLDFSPEMVYYISLWISKYTCMNIFSKISESIVILLSLLYHTCYSSLIRVCHKSAHLYLCPSHLHLSLGL
jgi:hypothetical protein